MSWQTFTRPTASEHSSQPQMANRQLCRPPPSGITGLTRAAGATGHLDLYQATAGYAGVRSPMSLAWLI